MTCNNRYRNIEQIDYGGHSKIYRAYDVNEQQIVVLKRTDHERAIIEFEVLTAMDSPLFPKVFDYFNEAEYSYVVMEYIDGRTLLELKEEGNLLRKNLYHIMLKVGEGLRMLHNMRPAIVWGDLKPSNVMISNAGEVKLIDFGTAVIEFASVGESARYGTRFYAAPEQYDSAQSIDERSDIYAFGATFHCLLGKSCRRCDKRILERCMMPEKEARYQTVAELLFHLKRGHI